MTPTITPSELRQTLAEIAFLTKEIKRRCMVFHVEYKEQRAMDLELPFWAFYHLPYSELGILKTDRGALEWFTSHRAEAAQAEKADFERIHLHDGQFKCEEA